MTYKTVSTNAAAIAGAKDRGKQFTVQMRLEWAEIAEHRKDTTA